MSKDGSKIGFLCVSAKVGDFIEVGLDLNICIIRVKGNYVRLGFKAPKKIPIQLIQPKHGLIEDAQKGNECHPSEVKKP